MIFLIDLILNELRGFQIKAQAISHEHLGLVWSNSKPAVGRNRGRKENKRRLHSATQPRGSHFGQFNSNAAPKIKGCYFFRI